jgi:hypothetical protein
MKAFLYVAERLSLFFHRTCVNCNFPGQDDTYNPRPGGCTDYKQPSIRGDVRYERFYQFEQAFPTEQKYHVHLATLVTPFPNKALKHAAFPDHLHSLLDIEFSVTRSPSGGRLGV